MYYDSGDFMRILIVEDEKNLAEAIAARLKKEKFIVDISNDGETGLDNVLTNNYDLVILDVMLPKLDGFEILKEARSEKITSKIIMLTAREKIEDKLNGLTSGANDYLTKPFHIDELVARINVLLKKDLSEIKKKTLEFSDIVLDVNNSTATCKTTNETIEIIGKEYFLLEYFIKNPNQIISKEQIYCKIWGMENESESNNLEAYLSFLRRKLRSIGSHINIKAIRGMGYKIEGEKNE